MTADEIAATLDLAPHPEGGRFRQIWVAEAPEGTRPAASLIYFLLSEGEASHWHRVDADEIWHWHAGAPLTLCLSADDAGPAASQTLGPALALGERPAVVVPAGHWQSAQSRGAFTLVSCTVAPAFRFDGFTLAPRGFDIPRA